MTHTKCQVCGRDVEAGTQVCRVCSDKLGLPPGEGARPRLPCARCNHPELVRAIARELTVTADTDFNDRVTIPMAVTYAPAFERSIWTGKQKDSVDGADEGIVFGILDMYVCRRCGFTEWYCRDPKKIPIGEKYGTELVSADSKTPYR